MSVRTRTKGWALVGCLFLGAGCSFQAHGATGLVSWATLAVFGVILARASS